MSGFLFALVGCGADSGEHAAGDAPLPHSLGSGQIAGALAPSDTDRQQDESAEDSAAEKDDDRKDEKRGSHKGSRPFVVVLADGNGAVFNRAE